MKRWSGLSVFAFCLMLVGCLHQEVPTGAPVFHPARDAPVPAKQISRKMYFDDQDTDSIKAANRLNQDLKPENNRIPKETETAPEKYTADWKQ